MRRVKNLCAGPGDALDHFKKMRARGCVQAVADLIQNGHAWLAGESTRDENLPQFAGGELPDVSVHQMLNAQQSNERLGEGLLTRVRFSIDIIRVEEAAVQDLPASQIPFLLQVTLLELRRHQGHLLLNPDRAGLLL